MRRPSVCCCSVLSSAIACFTAASEFAALRFQQRLPASLNHRGAHLLQQQRQPSAHPRHVCAPAVLLHLKPAPACGDALWASVMRLAAVRARSSLHVALCSAAAGCLVHPPPPCAVLLASSAPLTHRPYKEDLDDLLWNMCVHPCPCALQNVPYCSCGVVVRRPSCCAPLCTPRPYALLLPPTR